MYPRGPVRIGQRGALPSLSRQRPRARHTLLAGTSPRAGRVSVETRSGLIPPNEGPDMKHAIAKMTRQLRCLETAQLVLAEVGLLGGLSITTLLVMRGMRTEPVPIFVIVALTIGVWLTCAAVCGGLLLGRRRTRRGGGTKDDDTVGGEAESTAPSRQGASWRGRPSTSRAPSRSRTPVPPRRENGTTESTNEERPVPGHNGEQSMRTARRCAAAPVLGVTPATAAGITEGQ